MQLQCCVFILIAQTAFGFWGPFIKVQQKLQMSKSRRPVVQNNTSFGDLEKYNIELEELQKKMEDINLHYKTLKLKKNEKLKDIRGLKMLNESELEKASIDELIKLFEEDEEYDDDMSIPKIPKLLPMPQLPNIQIFMPPTQQNYYKQAQTQTRKKGKSSDNFKITFANNYNFSNIGGFDDYKEELMQYADMLVNFTKYSGFNVRTPQGIILSGPSGTGKTLLAKCYAGEMGIGYIVTSGSEFNEKLIGVGASRVRELFQLAKENVPCLIFIDEFDSIARKRSEDENNAETGTTLNQLLAEMDGFESCDGVMVMAATNRYELLDPAIVRPGRFDVHVVVDLPNHKARKSIVDLHVRGKPFNEAQVNLTQWVERTQGLTGAEIENVLNTAMLRAIRNRNKQMEQHDLEHAFQRVVFGSQLNEHQFSEKTLHHIAIHEMGHAIVSMQLPHHPKLMKVTINLWSPKSLGACQFEVFSSVLPTRAELFDHIVVLLSGQLSEKMFFDKDNISLGATDDLEKANALAYKMVNAGVTDNRAIFHPHASDSSKFGLETEIRQLIDEATVVANVILADHKLVIEQCAKELVLRKSLSHSEITYICGGKSHRQS
jgi:cell division protease FtsH